MASTAANYIVDTLLCCAPGSGAGGLLTDLMLTVQSFRILGVDKWCSRQRLHQCLESKLHDKDGQTQVLRAIELTCIFFDICVVWLVKHDTIIFDIQTPQYSI